MRIGVDLWAIQAPSCRGRGIGRYAESLLHALLSQSATDDEFVFYRRPDLPLDWPTTSQRRTAWADVAPDPFRSADGSLQAIVQANPHRLDWLLIPNPLVERRGFALPEPVPGGPRLAALVHDLIPALFPRHYLDAPGLAAEYANDLRRLGAYDLILANSRATGHDVHEHLGISKRRIVNIRAASDPVFFRPASNDDERRADDLLLESLAIPQSFLYYLGNVDWRKNVLGCVEAYALLPETIRWTYPLVLTFGKNAWFRAVLDETIERLGLSGRVLTTGPATDESVRALCRRCSLFLSPSRYEGFGLPILEAMSCGAPVVAADNSSQPEVVGTAGIVAPTDDPSAWAATIAALLDDPQRLSAMRVRSREQALTFSWDDSARRLREALDSAPIRPMRPAPDRVAVVVYPSPREPGYDAESARFVRALTGRNDVLAFLRTDSAATLPPLPLRAGWRESSLLTRLRPVLGNPPVVHVVDQMTTFAPLIEVLGSHPGPVTLVNRETIPPDDALTEILRLAPMIACRSRAIGDRITRLEPSARVEVLSATDHALAAEALVDLARLLETMRCPG